jgi:hypothetical protein
MPTTYRITRAEVTSRTPGARALAWAAVLTFEDGTSHDTGDHALFEAVPPLTDGVPHYHHHPAVAALLAQADDAAGYEAALRADIERVIAEVDARRAAPPDALDLSHLIAPAPSTA